MTLITMHPVQEGIDRLLNIMIDAGCYEEWSGIDRPRPDANRDLQDLFEGYKKLLRQGYREAEAWWEETVRVEIRDGDEITAEAIEAAFDKRAAGPASDPRIVWIVRLVWFECVQRNRKLPEDQRVRPEYLLVQWLIDEKEEDLVALLACMPYWPIGLDENGNWC